MIHDDSITRDTLHDLVDGLASAEGQGVRHASVITYKVDVQRAKMSRSEDGNAVQNLDHTKCMDSGARDQFSAAHLTRHIQSDPSLTHFLLVGNQQTIESVVEEVSIDRTCKDRV